MVGRVFISYSRTDRRYVEQVAAHLTGADIPVWYDYDVAAGERFASVIQQQIDTCSAFLVVLTPASAASEWVGREISYAVERGRTVVPLLLAPCVSPILVAGLHLEDVRGGHMPSPRLVAYLRGLATASAATTPPTPAASPDTTAAPRSGATSDSVQISRAAATAAALRRRPGRWFLAAMLVLVVAAACGIPIIANWMSGASPSASAVSERLVGEATATKDGLTDTVTRLAEVPGAGQRATRVEVIVANDTGSDAKVPLDFDNCALDDDDGNALPASRFYTNTDWTGSVPAHAFRRMAVTFERTLPRAAAMAELVLSLKPVTGLTTDTVLLAVPGITLRTT